MKRTCKCEHWQQCPICMPHRFDAEGNLLPPEPTPLQACQAQVKALTAALFQAQEAAKQLANQKETSSSPDPAPLFAHRLALMLECALLDPNGAWDEAHKTLDEYRAAVQQWHEANGEAYVSPFGKD